MKDVSSEPNIDPCGAYYKIDPRCSNKQLITPNLKVLGRLRGNLATAVVPVELTKTLCCRINYTSAKFKKSSWIQ